MALTTTATNNLTLTLLDTVPAGAAGLKGAEIAAFDKTTDRIFVTANAESTNVTVGAGSPPLLHIIDAADPTNLSIAATIDFTTYPELAGFALGDISSVAVSVDGTIAVGLIANPKTDAGRVVFIGPAGSFLGQATVGSQPDMVTFTPNGSKVLVAIEGEPGTVDPKGGVSIIDISAGTASPTVTFADFTAFDAQQAALVAEGLRLFPGKTLSDDVEPEYISVSTDGTKAMVTLQEANAVAILNLTTSTFDDIVPLGAKDWSGLQIDTSDTGGTINLQTGKPISGLYMPDAISTFQAGGQTYYVIANEGDDRGENARVGSSTVSLDATVFPNAATLETNAELGRLNVSTIDGNTDADPEFEALYAYGARSFSILNSAGEIVFDSADIIERIIATNMPSQWVDSRSDDKGPEPEGITVGSVGGRTYAFVALERTSHVMAFDVTNPNDVSYATYVNTAGDTSPEGIVFVKAADSPNGQDLLIVSNEVSNTLSVYSATSEIDFTLQLLHFADAEAGLLASTTAPYLAALVDAFDDDYANTLILAGGDNYLPGPFLNAGTDPSVTAIVGLGTNLGAADIKMHNIIGVEASTIGNHEFDLGTREFNDAVVDAQFPYLSANLDFSADSNISGRYTETVGVNGLEQASNLKGRIVPSAVVTKGGEQIGLVGVTTQILESISSTGGVEVKGFAGDGLETNDMAQLATLLQPVINDLIGQGVNKIVLMAHLQQIAFEQALAPLLTGVDIILAAGSNTRLGDADDVAQAFTGHAADFANTYPIVTAGADGKPTVIVNTDNEFTYLGRLVVDFDADGEIILDNLAETTGINGAYASTAANVAEAWGVEESELATTAFADGTKGENVADITEAVQAVITSKDGNVYGYTDVYLEGERNIVRNQETNLGSLTADANKYAAEQALGASAEFVVSLKNGGGIRSAIGAVDFVTGEKIAPIANASAGKDEGGVSQLDVENSLRFNNQLMVFDTTAAGLKAILEHGVARLGNEGRFPQIGGVAFSFDKDLPANSRITSIALVDANDEIVARIYENGAFSADLPATISVVTLNFLAGNTTAPNGNEPGGDLYPIRANGSNFRYLLADGTLSAPVAETSNFTDATVIANAAGTVGSLGEQLALARYMQEFHATPAAAYDEAETAIANDTRIQNLDFRTDTVLKGVTETGDADANRIDGGLGDDTLSGEGGADTIVGGIGNDTLTGGEGVDKLYGDAGNDTLDGSTGETVATRDSLAGGRGNDVYNVNIDRIVEAAGEGTDTVNIYGSGFTAFKLDAGAEIEAINLATNTVTTVIGNEFGQTIFNAGNNTASLRGYGGDDTITGNVGSETIWGDFANGTGAGVAGNDTLDGGAGTDKIYGEAGNDSLTGGADADYLYGGSGNDALDGTTGETTTAIDYLYGGAGDDTYTAGFNDQIIEAAGEGTDTVNLSGSGVFKMRAGSEIEVLNVSGSPTTVIGNEFGQTITDNSGLATNLRGFGGNDVIFGNAGADTLWGDFANGTGAGVAGNDELRGGAGADKLYGEAGDDFLFGEADNDTLSGGDGVDTIEGGAGVDKLYGDAGNDVLDGGTENDLLEGGLGNDTMTGGAGSDRFLFRTGTAFGTDTIVDLAAGDKIDLRGWGLAYGDLSFASVAGGVEVSATAFGAGNVIIINGASGTIADTQFLF